jgi:zinc transport system substrate-binding protein
MHLKSLKIILLFILVLTIAGCSNTERTNEKIKIYTTIYAIEDFTKKIGGSLVEVHNLIPAGADAHTFEPTAKEIVNVATADAFIYTGVGMEGFINSLVETLQNEDVLFIKASSGLSLHNIEVESHEEHEEHGEHEEHEEHGEHDEHEEHEEHGEHDEHEEHGEHEESNENETDAHDHGLIDPHIWLDPVLAKTIAHNIKEGLIKLDPENAQLFETNFLQLQAELEDLHAKFQKTINSSAKKEILVTHAAYGYWEKRYGIHQHAITGLSPTNEPSQKQLLHLIDVAKQEDIKYIIFEQNVTPNVALVIKKELQAQTLTLHNLAVLTATDENNKEDYFSIMNKNLKTLEKALK